MNKKIKIIFILIGSYILGFSLGYIIYKGSNLNNSFIKNIKDKELDLNSSELIQVGNTDYKINEDTVMIYEYLNNDGKILKVLEDLPPYYLIGLDRDDINEVFQGWSMYSFSSDKVVLQKVIEDEENYFLSSYNGKVAIFSNNEANEQNLIEVLNKSVISLPEEEQEKIKKGIYIKGKMSLISYIQDYES